MNIRKLGINILGPNIHVHVISMDWVLYKLLTAHTAHEILWTMPWTPWIVMREQPAFRAVLPGASARQVWRSVVKLLFCRQNFCAVVKFGAHSVVKLSFRLVNILLCRHNLKQNKIVGLWTFKSIALNPFLFTIFGYIIQIPLTTLMDLASVLSKINYLDGISSILSSYFSAVVKTSWCAPGKFKI